MVTNPYATGAKVYNGGSSAAHSGKSLDPMGYVIRERLKNSMPGNQSQRRSGLAEKALRRGGVGTPPGSQTLGGNNQQGGQQQGGQAGGQAQGQSVLVSPNGQLNLPWSMESYMRAISAQENLNSTLEGNMDARHEFNQEYSQQLRQGALGFDQQQDATLNNAAGRGMAFSSGYGQQVAQNATNYNDWQASMAGQKAAFGSQLKENNTDARNQFMDTLRRLAIAQGMDLEQYAGQLGLGRDRDAREKPRVNKPRANKPNRKPRVRGGRAHHVR